MIVHLPSELQGRVSSISVGHLASAKRLHDRILLSFKEVVVFGVGFIFHIGVRGNAVYPGTGANVPSELLNYYITHIDGKDIFIARAGSGTI